MSTKYYDLIRQLDKFVSEPNTICGQLRRMDIGPTASIPSRLRNVPCAPSYAAPTAGTSLAEHRRGKRARLADPVAHYPILLDAKINEKTDRNINQPVCQKDSIPEQRGPVNAWKASQAHTRKIPLPQTDHKKTARLMVSALQKRGEGLERLAIN